MIPFSKQVFGKYTGYLVWLPERYFFLDRGLEVEYQYRGSWAKDKILLFLAFSVILIYDNCYR